MKWSSCFTQAGNEMRRERESVHARKKVLLFIKQAKFLTIYYCIWWRKIHKAHNLLGIPLTSGPIKWNMVISWLTELYKHLEDYVSQNLIPNLLPNSKDYQRLEPFYDFGSRFQCDIGKTLRRKKGIALHWLPKWPLGILTTKCMQWVGPDMTACGYLIWTIRAFRSEAISN